MVAEYLEHALQFERMAAQEAAPTLKASFGAQAVAYRKLAEKRAAEIKLPPVNLPGPKDGPS
jgi:surfactin synthase thioesterase subunit